MKAIVIAALLALSFTTGFTCSKNQPAETTAPAVEATTTTTETTTTPVEGTPADATAPAATETPAATPAQ